MNTQRLSATAVLPVAFLALLFAGLLLSCDPHSSSVKLRSGAVALGASSVVDLGYEDFAGADILQLTVSGVQGKRLVVAKLNPGSSLIAGSKTGSFSSLSPAPLGVARSRALGQEAVMTGAHARPVRLERRFPVLPPVPLSRSLLSEGAGPTISYGTAGRSVGDTEQFWVQAYEKGPYVQINATLAVARDHCYIWEFTGLTDPLATTPASPTPITFDPTTITILADAFEEVVFPAISSVFGYEYGGGPGGDGGKDGDQHVSILLYDIDFDFYEDLSHGIFGFFAPNDEYDSASSNRREMFYLDSGFFRKYPFSIVSTLAHEYQHMINWARYQGTTEPQPTTFINELRSLEAEDLIVAPLSTKYPFDQQNGTGYDPVEDGPLFRVQRFNKIDVRYNAVRQQYEYYTNPDIGYDFGAMNAWWDSLDDYSFAFVFGAYLSRSYGGAPFLKKWMEEGADQAALSRAIGSSVASAAAHPGALTAVSTGSAYADLLEPFVRSLYGLGVNGSPSPLSRADADAAIPTDPLKKLSPFGFGSSVIDLPPIAYGPADAVDLLPLSFTLHMDAAWEPLEDDSATISIERPSSATIRFALIFSNPDYAPAP